MHTGASTCQSSTKVSLSSQVLISCMTCRNTVFCEPLSLHVNCLKRDSSSKQALKEERQAHTHITRQTDCSCFPRKPKLKYQSPRAALLKRKGPWSPRFCTVQRSTGTCARKARTSPWRTLVLLGSAAVNAVGSLGARGIRQPEQIPSFSQPVTSLVGICSHLEVLLGLQLCTAPAKRDTVRLLRLLPWSSPPVQTNLLMEEDTRVEATPFPAPMKKSHRPQLTCILPGSQPKGPSTSYANCPSPSFLVKVTGKASKMLELFRQKLLEDCQDSFSCHQHGMSLSRVSGPFLSAHMRIKLLKLLQAQLGGAVLQNFLFKLIGRDLHSTPSSQPTPPS